LSNLRSLIDLQICAGMPERWGCRERPFRIASTGCFKGVIARFTLAFGDMQEENAIEAFVLLKVGSVDTRPLIMKLRKSAAIRTLGVSMAKMISRSSCEPRQNQNWIVPLADIRSLQQVLDTN